MINLVIGKPTSVLYGESKRKFCHIVILLWLKVMGKLSGFVVIVREMEVSRTRIDTGSSGILQ